MNFAFFIRSTFYVPRSTFSCLDKKKKKYNLSSMLESDQKISGTSEKKPIRINTNDLITILTGPKGPRRPLNEKELAEIGRGSIIDFAVDSYVKYRRICIPNSYETPEIGMLEGVRNSREEAIKNILLLLVQAGVLPEEYLINLSENNNLEGKIEEEIFKLIEHSTRNLDFNT